MNVNGFTQSIGYDTGVSYNKGRSTKQFLNNGPCRVQITYTGRVCPIYVFYQG